MTHNDNTENGEAEAQALRSNLPQHRNLPRIVVNSRVVQAGLPRPQAVSAS